MAEPTARNAASDEPSLKYMEFNLEAI